MRHTAGWIWFVAGPRERRSAETGALRESAGKRRQRGRSESSCFRTPPGLPLPQLAQRRRVAAGSHSTARCWSGRVAARSIKHLAPIATERTGVLSNRNHRARPAHPAFKDPPRANPPTFISSLIGAFPRRQNSCADVYRPSIKTSFVADPVELTKSEISEHSEPSFPQSLS
jgi:hypothetical protein